MKHVATPFVADADDPRKGPARKPVATGGVLQCSWCKHTVPFAQYPNIAWCDAENQKKRRRNRPILKVMSRMLPWMRVRVAARPRCTPHPGKVVFDNEEGVLEGEDLLPPQQGSTGKPRQELSGIGARVLMKVLYAARLARFDLLRAIGHLSTYFTCWDDDCDRRLHRLMCYIHSTLSLRSVGWVGDDLSLCRLHLYADADFGGCVRTQRSTSGVHLSLLGPSTCFPLGGASKRQKNTSWSTPEAEMVSAVYALQTFGLPSLILWDSILQRANVLQFHEDNQATIQIARTGRNPTMRYLPQCALDS